MKKSWRTIYFTAGILAIACIAAPKAHAYLDPGSGSMMVQLLLAGIASAVLGLKIFWRKILSFFGLGKGATSKDRKPPF
jgi:hypothetical protein